MSGILCIVASINFDKDFKLVITSIFQKGLFAFTVRISVRRKASDGVVCDEGIAIAIPEEQNTPDDALQPTEN
jgi:hypothetical protein